MGFEVTSDGAVAQLPDTPMSVQQSLHKTQMPAKSAGSAASRAVTGRPTVAPTSSKAADGAVITAAKDSVSAVADSKQQSLYKIIRQRSQMKLSTEDEQARDLSADADDSALTHDVNADGSQCLQHEPSVKFCLENNAFISASSADESQCR